MKCSITSQLLISKLFLQKPLVVLLWSGQNQSEKSLQHFIRHFFFFEKTLLYCPKYDSSSLNYLYSLNELKKFPLSGKMQILHIFDFVALFTILSRVDAVRLELWPANHCTVILFFFSFLICHLVEGVSLWYCSKDLKKKKRQSPQQEI